MIGNLLTKEAMAVVSELFALPKTNQFFSKQEPEHLQDDLKQYTFTCLCEMAAENPQRLLNINQQPGALFGYMTKIAKMQMRGGNSTFRNTYRKTNIVDIDNRPDADCTIQPDLDFGSNQHLREEILRRWLAGEAVYENDLASVQAIYSAGRSLRAELQYLKDQNNGFLQEAYVLFSVPVMVRITMADIDKVVGAGSTLTNTMQKLIGRQLGRENDAFVVRCGDAVVIESNMP